MHRLYSPIVPTLASLLHLCGWCLLVWQCASGTPLSWTSPCGPAVHIICIPGTIGAVAAAADADTPALPVPAQRAPACLGCDV